jgi:beta-lactam-binding protein with PASTA domain
MFRAAGLLLFVLAMALPAGCSSPSTDDSATPAMAARTSAAPSETPGGLPSGVPGGPGLPGATAAGMPDVVGRRLSDAEAALSAAGLMSVNAVDGSGRGRHILEKDNWVVQKQNPQPGEAIMDGAAVTLTVTKPTDDQQTIEAEPGVIPAVVCHDLQDAQDAMRGAGFYVVIAKDGLGQKRYPLIDRNCIVVGQSAKAGSRPEKKTVIELTVVKFGEPTGSSGCKS